MKKNYRLLVILGALVVISGALRFTADRATTTDFRVDLFTVGDTAAIRSVVINDGMVEITRNDRQSWMVNNKYAMDPNLKAVLLAVLDQVTVKRPVSKIQKEQIAEKLMNGTKVTVSTESGEIDFYAGGNAARTQSYFMLAESDQPYIVEIPGYRNYISGIFGLTEMQWRDRRLFNTHWRSLQSLKVNYPGNPTGNLHIFFDEDFFRVEGIEKMDTTSLMSYLQPFEYFEANEFVPVGFSSRYDSLAKTQPLAVIELNEINRDNDQLLRIFPKLEDEDYLLTVNKDDEFALVNFNRIRVLLSQPSDFR